MKNEDLKRDLVSSGRFQQYCQVRHDLIDDHIDETKEDYDYLSAEFDKDEFDKQIYCLTEQRLYKQLYSSKTYDLDSIEFEACEQLRQAKNRQRQRIKKHLMYWVDGLDDSHIIIFGTLTFNNEDLDNLPKTRQKYVQRALNEFCDDYIANIDYGSENEREHYHFVALCSSDGMYKMPYTYINKKTGKESTKVKITHSCIEKWSSKHGYALIKKVAVKDKSLARVIEYMTKLTNHSIKVQQQKVIVKKGTPYQDFKRERGKSDKDILQVIDEFENLLDSMNDMIASS